MTPAVHDRNHTGRPLDPDLSEAILDATVEVLAETGYGRLSIEAVAQRAGVYRPAIYRRWPTKVDLVAAAVGSIAATVPDPETGSTRDDLVAVVRHIANLMQRNPRTRLGFRVMADLAVDREVVALVNARMVRPWRDIVAGIVERGIARGELRDDVDAEFVSDLLLGPLYARSLSGRGQPNRAGAERYVDRLLDGIAARPRAARGRRRAP